MFESFGEVAVLVLVAVLAAGLGWLLHMVFARGQGSSAESLQELEQTKSALELERTSVAQLQTECTQWQTQCAQSGERAEGLAREVTYLQEQIEQLHQAERDRLAHQAQLALRQEQERHERQVLESQEQSRIVAALAPMRDHIDLMRKKLEELDKGRVEQMGRIDLQVRQLDEQQRRLIEQTSTLASALRNNSVRGSWGEAQLRNIVKHAGLLDHVDFEMQKRLENDDHAQLRPDMIVHLPEEHYLVIDAKAPFADYQRACDIPDDAPEAQLRIRQEHLRNHAKAIMRHVDALSQRKYAENLRGSADMVVLFLPHEAFLMAAVEQQAEIIEYAFSKNVALATPITLWAVLKSVAYSWHQQKLSTDVEQLYRIAQEVYDRFATLGTHAAKLGKSLSSSVNHYNNFVKSLESRMMPKIRELREYGATKALPEVTQIESSKAQVVLPTSGDLSLEASDDE